MATKVDTSDDESFIILGTSPGTSLDVKFANGDVLDKSNLEDALKELSDEANMAFKAHFLLSNCQSPASMMVASTMVTDDATTEDLQKRFGELLDENLILKETLKKTNDSMKEHIQLITSCQDDMLKTQTLHKEKFEETKELVEKLRQENKKLKQNLQRRLDDGPPSDTSSSKSGPSSGLEFVTSPDDDTINKLTAQLELVEKQRRQVLVDNEKLTWQKESLEHIVDATTKERDDLREKLQKLELQLCNKDSECSLQMSTLKSTISELENKILATSSVQSVAPEELIKRDTIIKQLDCKLTTLQMEQKNSQLKIMELENIKLEFTKYKSGTLENQRMHKEQLQELQNRLREAQTLMFQPVRLTLNSESDSLPSTSEYSSLMANVKLYDRTLKHLADLLNSISTGLSDNLGEAQGVALSLLEFKLERSNVDQFKLCLGDLRRHLDENHRNSLKNIVQVKSTLSIFEGIFKDYNELLKKTLTRTEVAPPSPNIEALTSALLARGQEIQNLEAELKTLRNQKDDVELLRAQADLYKSDFEAERESRTKIASEKENIMVELRNTQKRNKELTQQMEEVKRIDPGTYRTATNQGGDRPNTSTSGTSNGATKKVTMSVCPICRKFKSNDEDVMQYHANFCIDATDPCTTT